MAKRFTYVVEDLADGKREEFATMHTAKSFAKAASMATGHVIAVIAIDHTDDSWHPQGAYYGRSWREGAYHYQGRGR